MSRKKFWSCYNLKVFEIEIQEVIQSDSGTRKEKWRIQRKERRKKIVAKMIQSDSRTSKKKMENAKEREEKLAKDSRATARKRHIFRDDVSGWIGKEGEKEG